MAACSGLDALHTRLARVIGITRKPTILDICKTSLSFSLFLSEISHGQQPAYYSLCSYAHAHTLSLSLGEIAIKSSAKGQQSLDDVSFFLF